MPGTCVVGLQWGDEAKGKIVDLLADQHEMVVRYQGGSNAGHTVVTGGQVYKLSLLPSGIVRPGVLCVVTGGVVVNPRSLLGEIDQLAERGVEVGSNLLVSDRAHVVFPWHLEEERLLDPPTGNGQPIGTTMRGIGPCYRDKMGRVHAVRLGDLYRPGFADRIRRITAIKNRELSALSVDAAFDPLDAERIISEYQEYARRLQPHVGDTTCVLLDAMESGQRVLFEGAQGSLLDIDHGTFPFVTSSNSSGVGIASGSGVPGKYMTKCVGVFKAYSTRVGGGPFPTEQDNEIGEHLRERGHEYGTVTGRPRRCGWFDAVAGRYAARLSGVDSLAVTLLDVLSELDELRICVAYDIRGTRTTIFPSQIEDLQDAVPVYESLPGWTEDLSGARQLADLPENARAYLNRLSKVIGRGIEYVSVGPDRDQTIVVTGRLDTFMGH